MSRPDRIVTVSTLRDTLANVRWFVDRTLASGVDHMFVFLDQRQPRLHGYLAEHPHVSVVPTGSDYWHAERPPRVEERQSVNATLANAVCAAAPSVRWLFHIDCDEALDFDRDALLAGDDAVVRFPTREVVAEGGDVDRDRLRFKRMPTQPQLLALAGLGAISEPDLEYYLRGHAAGKSGLRPDLRLRMTVHVVNDDRGIKAQAATPEEAHLLHYDSWCVRDLTARWQDLTRRKAARSNHRERRKRLGLAVSGVVNHPLLEEEIRQQYLQTLFDRHVADDVASLRALDLVVDKVWPAREPLGLAEADLAVVGALLESLRPLSKAPFRSDAAPGAVIDHLEKVVTTVDDAEAASRLRTALDTCRSPGRDRAEGSEAP